VALNFTKLWACGLIDNGETLFFQMSIPFIWAVSNQRCEEEDLLKKSETDLTATPLSSTRFTMARRICLMVWRFYMLPISIQRPIQGH
jgi:hypothetical protein